MPRVQDGPSVAPTSPGRVDGPTAEATLKLRDDDVTVLIAQPQKPGHGVATLWRGQALLGILHQEEGTIVLRLESHARGPLMLNAITLERALAEARGKLASV